MLSISEVMFGLLRAAKGHIKSARPSNKKANKKHTKIKTMLPSTFPLQVIAYSSSSSHFLLPQSCLQNRQASFNLKFLSSAMLTALISTKKKKKKIFPPMKRKIRAKMKEDIQRTSLSSTLCYAINFNFLIHWESLLANKSFKIKKLTHFT